MDERNITIVLWGDCSQMKNWYEWYTEAKSIFQKLGYPLTHIGIISESFHNGKVLTAKRKEKAILEKLQIGELPDDIGCYSLPKHYKVACFDYDFLYERGNTFIFGTLKEQDFSEKIEVLVLSAMKKYIAFNHGEIFACSRDEVPLLYIATEDSSNLRTYEQLKII